MRSLPPLAAIRAFEAAARLRHFSRAGEELGISQAGISYQIKLLEERLGAPLFARNGRSVALTPLGEQIAPRISAAFDALDTAFAAVRDDATRLLITTSISFASNWLAPRLSRFQQRQPELTVRLLTSDAVLDLARGEADVAIRTARQRPPGLEAWPLMRAGLMPLASPALLARYPRVTTPDDVMALPRLSPDDCWWNFWAEAAGGGPPPPQAGRMSFEAQLLEGSAALAGEGVAILNVGLWGPQIAAGQLVAPFAKVAYAPDSYWLCCPPERARSRKVRALRAWLAAEIALLDDPFGLFAPG
ncbi:MAG: hypothetical protein A4S16_00710 [Proteobacteria bacterium SG_bin6]|nr:MAG: hypothetical protein A4S16_00710 [Proteobacteria bacterium SG_bin6]